jgi:hypothetical protein
MQPGRGMKRFSLLLALFGATGCIHDVCASGCQSQYDACLVTGRTKEECGAMLANCEDSCVEQP